MQTNDVGLIDLIKKIRAGEIQLPDFQRDWVWNEKKIRFLISSVLSEYPIGALMFLAYNKNKCLFAYRPIEGAPYIKEEPEELVLDGQQRLTALYCSMYSDKPVKIKKAKVFEEYLFFVDIEEAVAEIDNIDKSVKAVKIGTKNSDLTISVNQYEKKYFPLNIILDEEKKEDWFDGYKDFYGKDSDAAKKAKQFKTSIAAKVTGYKIPIIMLEKDKPLESVCRMFENINQVGIKLNEFDLLTATFAKYNFNLREDWNKIKNKKPFNEDNVLRDVEGAIFLVACTLLTAYKKGIKSCEKKDVLELPLDDYKDCRDNIRNGFVEVKNFLADEKIFRSNDLPYKPQLIPLSVLFAIIKKTSFDNAATKNKIRQWYWCGVFGEVYNNAANMGRYINHINEVMDWIKGGDTPKIVKDLEFSATSLLNGPGGAIYKGIIAIILQNRSKDFIQGDDMGTAFFNDKNVEIHHIFPQKYCKQKKFDKDKWDSALNKTPLINDTNNKLGGDAPSKYLKRINLDEETLTAVLKSNWIDIDDLKKDDFDSFLVHRAKKILDVIEKICGKKFGRADVEVINKFGQSLE